MMSITDNNFTGSECDHRSNSSKDCSDRYVNHWNNWGIYYLIIVYRLSLAVLTITTYLPDEYYQTIEPSYRIVFGKGIKTWEWEDEHRIRSYVALLPYVSMYWALKVSGLHNYPLVMEKAPRITQAALTIMSDVYLLKIARLSATATQRTTGNMLLGMKIDRSSLMMAVHLLSWSCSYMLGRCLANSTETVLWIIGFYYWYQAYYCRDPITNQIYHIIAATISTISTFCRPNMVLLWVPLILYLTHDTTNTLLQTVEHFIKIYIPVATTLLEVLVLIESWFYGQFTVPFWNFYVRNVKEGIALEFGVKPWHWCISTGIPTLLGGYILLLMTIFCCKIVGLTKISWIALYSHCPHNVKLMTMIGSLYAIGLSMITSHQEDRFLLPTTPALHLLIGFLLSAVLPSARVMLKADVDKYKNKDVDMLACEESSHKTFSMLFLVICLVHLSAIGYLTRLHQAGTEVAFSYINKNLYRTGSFSTSSDSTVDQVTARVYVLAPCYSFPAYSFLHSIHYDVTINMASCSPIFKGNKTSSSDNSENSLCLRGFNTFPASCFMEQLNFSGMITESGILSGITSREIHDGTIDKDSNNFVVTFDIYLQQRELSALLTSLNYKVIRRFPHAYFRYDYDDPFPKREVILLQKQTTNIL